MNDVADIARANAIHCEAKKHAYRQTQDGVVVSFVLHPSEVPDGLATSPLGSRYVLALVQVNDDETPVLPQQKEDKTSPGQPVHKPPADRVAVKERRAFDTLLPAQQAGIWCNEPAFWKFLEEKYPIAWAKFTYDDPREVGAAETVAAGVVRHLCGVNSRGSIKPDNRAWRDIVGGFQAWKLAA